MIPPTDDSASSAAPEPPLPLVVLFGAPAVGKMTVGMALRDLTGLPLFHNHVTLELVLPYFAFGSPPFEGLVHGFREAVFREVAASGQGLIFTWVWALDDPGKRRFIDDTIGTFAACGARTLFVELCADLAVRLQRNRTELRLREKPSKRDVEASERRLLGLESRHRLAAGDDFPFPDLLRIDNSRLAPAIVADHIAVHFGLPRRARGD